MKINPKVDPISYVDRWKMQKAAEKAQKEAEIKETSPKVEKETSKEVKRNGKSKES